MKIGFRVLATINYWYVSNQTRHGDDPTTVVWESQPVEDTIKEVS